MSKGGEAGRKFSESYNFPCLRQIQTILSHRCENTLVAWSNFFLLLQRVNAKCSSRRSLYRTSYRGWNIIVALRKQAVMTFTVAWIHLNLKLKGTDRPPHPIHPVKCCLPREHFLVHLSYLFTVCKLLQYNLSLHTQFQEVFWMETFM